MPFPGRRIAALPTVLLAGLLTGLLGACAAEREPLETRFRGPTMGTTWTVVLSGQIPQQQADAWQGAFEQELERLNAVFSGWDPSSAMARFNASDSTRFTALPAELLDLLDAAHAISRASDGAYDATLGEVLALYGVGPGTSADAEADHALDADVEADADGIPGSVSDGQPARPVSLPSAEALADALARTGPAQLVRLGDRLRKRDARVRIDLSSIAKGYAVDRLGETLESGGVEDYLVEIGGELRTRGRAPGAQAWRVGIETPDGTVDAGLALNDAHLASSGSYRDWRELDGVRVSHVIDARDGRPLRHDLVAVTVLADSTALADAWATALLVVGAERARQLGARHDLHVQLVQRADEGFSTWRSPGFAALIATDEEQER